MFLEHLEGRVYSCRLCKSHLAQVDDLVSKEQAVDKSQKYKEGKFILERAKMMNEFYNTASEMYEHYDGSDCE
eukprot:gene12268-14489_t